MKKRYSVVACNPEGNDKWEIFCESDRDDYTWPHEFDRDIQDFLDLNLQMMRELGCSDAKVVISDLPVPPSGETIHADAEQEP